MIKQGIQKLLGHLGYKIVKTHRSPPPPPPPPGENTSGGKSNPFPPPPVEPVWPLPRRPDGLSDKMLRKEFEKHDLWHYTYEFEGGFSFSSFPGNPWALPPEQQFQRFRHFMPYLTGSQNDSLRGGLEGKRVLDIACNAGFWSIQCALLGAKEVVGFDYSPNHIKQADLIKSITGINNVEFKVLDFWDMSPQSLGGTFDVVLNLGILFLIPRCIA